MHFDSLNPKIGHSIRNTASRTRWIAMLEEVAEYVTREGLQEEILFHGTTLSRARSILLNGMHPTEAWEETDEGEMPCDGSFWGTLLTAAWYADDSAANRSGGAPTIIACPTSFIDTYASLRIDIPTRDFPVPGLTMIDDEQFSQRWAVGQKRDWRDSLADLGSCAALHDYDMPLNPAVILIGSESITRILNNNSFSA